MTMYRIFQTFVTIYSTTINENQCPLICLDFLQQLKYRVA